MSSPFTYEGRKRERERESPRDITFQREGDKTTSFTFHMEVHPQNHGQLGGVTSRGIRFTLRDKMRKSERGRMVVDSLSKCIPS